MLMTKKQVAAPFTCANGFVNTGSSCIPANVKCYGHPTYDAPCATLANGMNFSSVDTYLTIGGIANDIYQTMAPASYWYCPNITANTTATGTTTSTTTAEKIYLFDVNSWYNLTSVGLTIYAHNAEGRKNWVRMYPSTGTPVPFLEAYSSGGGIPVSGACTQTTTPKLVKNFGSYRAWNDGTYASSCNQYKDNSQGIYDGQTGDGVYRILLNGSTYDVYCLMSYDSAGWVRVAAMYSGVRTTPIQTSYSATNNYIATNISSLYPINSEYRLTYTQFSGACGYSGAISSQNTWANGYNYWNTSGVTFPVNSNGQVGYSMFSPNGYISTAVHGPSANHYTIAHQNIMGNAAGWKDNSSLVQGYWCYSYDSDTHTAGPAADYMYMYVR